MVYYYLVNVLTS